MGLETRYEETQCIRLKLKGLSISEIAKELNLSDDKVKKLLDTYKLRIEGKNLGEEEEEVFKPIEGGYALDKVGEYFTLSSDDTEDLYLYKDADRQREKITSYIEEKYRGKPVKILYMADLHIPFTTYELVNKIIENNSDADVLVINGDLLDLYAVSTFAKDKSVALKRELGEGRKFLELVSDIYEDVILVEGNHERRLRNYIKNVIPLDIQFLFPQDCLQVIADGTMLKAHPLKNVHVVGSWWIQLFDTIFAHPDNYNSPPMRTSINASEFFLTTKNIPHRALIMGHTHQAGWYVDRGRLMIESACLCHDMDYKNGSKFNKTAWAKGHVIVHINENGMISYNDTRLIVF